MEVEEIEIIEDVEVSEVEELEIIPISPTDDILINIHQVEQKQLERLEIINDFIFVLILFFVIKYCYKFIWGLLSYERF